MTAERRDPIEGRNPKVERPPNNCERCGQPVIRVSMSRHPQISVSVEPEPSEDGTVLVYDIGNGIEGKFLSGPEAFATARKANLPRHYRHGIKCQNPMGLKDKEFADWDKGPRSSATVNKEETS